MKMKINFILPFLSVTGGVRVVYELSNRLSDMGHEVKILYPVMPSQAHKGWLFNYPKVILSSLKRLVTKGVDWFDLDVELVKFPSLSPHLAGFSEKFIPDADITIATQRSTAYFVDRLSSKKGKKAYFIQHYEIWPLWEEISCWDKAKEINPENPSLGMVHINPPNKYLAKFKKYVDQSYDLPLQRIVTSSWEVDVMKELKVSFAGAIPYGVNFDMFFPIESDSEINGEINILALYRNSKLRGDLECIEAFKKLQSSNDNLNFIMFGEKRSELIPPFVTFFENPPQSKIRELYNKADILVYPTWVEGYGMPPMEAMACETALVTTDVGAVRDYTPYGNVSIVPIQNESAIVNAVQELVDDPRKIEMMKKAGLNKIKEFTWENSAHKFESLLLEIV